MARRKAGRRQLSPVTYVAVGTALALMLNLATDTIDVSWRYWPWVVWPAVAVLCGLAAAIEITRHTDGSDMEDLLAEAARNLSRRLLVAYRDQEWRHGVSRSLPLTVRYSSTGRPAAARSVVIGGEGDWQQFPMRGDVDEIVQAFRALPHGQLVILGEPGAGKSVLALLLSRQLLTEPLLGEPIPVLLPISSWNPESESVAAFISGRLADDHRLVGGRRGNRRLSATLAEAFRMDGAAKPRAWLLPVLDGLDELPPQRRQKAVAELDEFAASGHPLVLTCRSREYSMIVDATRRVLPRAAVVEIQPVLVEDAIDFLSHPDPDRPLWEPVFARLRADSTGVLATTLTTPLLVAMARVAYSRPGSDPGELAGLATRRAITDLLIDRYLAAAYDSDDPQLVAANTEQLRSYPPEQAARWLGCLAYRLYLLGTRDLLQPRFPLGLLSSRPSLTTGVWATSAVVLISLLAGLGAWLTPGPPSLFGAIVGAALSVGAAATGIFRNLWRVPWPSLLPGLIAHLAFGAIYGVAIGLLIDDLLFGVVSGTIVGGVVGGMNILHQLRVGNMGRIRQIRAATAALQYGLTAAIVGAGLAAWQPPERLWPWVVTMVFAVGAGLSAGWWDQIAFRLARLQLILSGWLPWRLNRFLDDAHQRGVLRQNGTVRQFRHALIQDRITATTQLQDLRIRADAGDFDAARRLATLLRSRGLAAELRERANRGHAFAAVQLSALLREGGDPDGAVAVLRAHADRDHQSAEQLASLLRELGDVEQLRQRVGVGDLAAGLQLAGLLRQRGDLAEAVAVLRPFAETDWTAAERLAALLLEQDDVEGAIVVLRRHADYEWEATRTLANVLEHRGDLAGAIDAVRLFADRPHWQAPELLARLLQQQGDVEQLRQRADGGDIKAAEQLAVLLLERGHVDQLRHRADQGDNMAAKRLASWLWERGDVEQLRQWADGETLNRQNKRKRRGRPDEESEAARRLTLLLWERGDVGELRERADCGSWLAGYHLAAILRQRGDLDEAIAVVRRHVNPRNPSRALVLAELLGQRGDHSEAISVLRDALRRGVFGAGQRLARFLRERGDLDGAIAVLRKVPTAEDPIRNQLLEYLRERGDIEELQERAAQGREEAARHVAQLLVARGDLDEAIAYLRPRADSPHSYLASAELARLLRMRGDAEELRQRADRGNSRAATELAGLLEDRGDIAGLRERVRQRDIDAAEALATLLNKRGEPTEAISALAPLAESGVWRASAQLAELLRRQGDTEQLRRRVDSDDGHAVRQLAMLLREHRDADGLRQLAEAGHTAAKLQLALLLQDQGDSDGATAILSPLAKQSSQEALVNLVPLIRQREGVDKVIASLRPYSEGSNVLREMYEAAVKERWEAVIKPRLPGEEAGDPCIR
ncbi:hypothetical protein Rhe02_92640 [Rhizocola hellebori]|uniref:NACHT domain-containing protein n=1 Tax=Rhizocola hellebori TaxID=1392758 RepID=A0A8J3QKA9_9ACTN|nr:hypothetical protein [Rhizocola hellebori]GIH11197.1 hypothetical protein Rhe02_92640 [Rhizocola hellebori]